MIGGVEVRNLQANADDGGHLVEVFHDVWKIYDSTPAMS